MILVALGANLPGSWGAPEASLRAALEQFPSYGLHVEAISPFYRTRAVTPYAQPDFINAVAHISTAMAPSALLAQLHRIEAAFGRVRGQRWEERTLDLDILDFDGLIQPEVDTNQLILPHPRLSDRAFVLVPLRDVAPIWCHPVTGVAVSKLLGALTTQDREGVEPLL